MAAAYHGHTSCFPDVATLEYGVMEDKPCILGQGVYLCAIQLQCFFCIKNSIVYFSGSRRPGHGTRELLLTL